MTQGSPVSFDLPTRVQLDLVKGNWIYRPIAHVTYMGNIVEVNEQQVIVYVASENKYCRVHPAMVRSSQC